MPLHSPTIRAGLRLGLVVGLLLALLTSACETNRPADGCHRDGDCPSGHCVTGTSTCVGLTIPLDAAIPDLLSVD